jgi:hypothetical protein
LKGAYLDQIVSTVVPVSRANFAVGCRAPAICGAIYKQRAGVSTPCVNRAGWHRQRDRLGKLLQLFLVITAVFDVTDTKLSVPIQSPAKHLSV